MWVKILKYAAQAAVTLGLHKKALGWITKKLEKSEDKAIDRLREVSDTLDKVYSASPELATKPLFPDEEEDL